MLGDFMQHQAEQTRSQSGSHFLKVQYAYWELELDCGGAGKMAKHPWDEKEALIY